MAGKIDLCVIVTLFYTSYASFENKNDKEVLLVQTVWRHGSRAPLAQLPLKESTLQYKWPLGNGELNDYGIKQAYGTGKWLEEMYGKFLGKYHPDKLNIRSTDSNRTIQTALIVAAGLFKISANESPLNLSWQPVPVHSVVMQLDPLLYIPLECNYTDSIYWNEIMKTKQVLDIMESNKELFEMLRNKTGLELQTLDNIYLVYEPIYSALNDELAKVHLPEWITKELYETIESLYHLSTTFYYSDPRIRPFRGGLLMDAIALHIKNKMNGFTPAAKFFGYSTHDMTLMGLLENLGVYSADMHPEFMATIVIELYRKMGKYYVEMLYRNGLPEPTVKVIKFPWCATPCEAETFVALHSGGTCEEWFELCKGKSKSWKLTSEGVVIVVLSIVVIALFLLLIASIFFGWRIKNSLKRMYNNSKSP